jgi:hypothetical protein
VSFTQLDSQADHTAQCLCASPPFWATLRNDQWYRKQVQAKSIPESISESDFVKWLAAHPFTVVEIREIFNAIRRSFKKADFNHLVDHGKKATVSLYCLVACKLVAVELFEQHSKVVSINTSVSFLCAVIATTLFGGKIQLRDERELDCPRHDGIFHIDLAAAGDWGGFEIERAAYCAIFSRLESTDRVTLGTGPLDEKLEVPRLLERINTLQNVDEISIALVLSKPLPGLNPMPFVQKYEVPLFMVSEGVDQALFRMTNEQFIAAVTEFWRGLHPDSSRGAPAQSNNPLPPESSMTINIINPTGPLSMSTGSHSNAVSGNNNTIQQNAPQGAQWEQVLAGLTELQALAQALPPDAKFLEEIKQKVTEAVKAAQSDKKPEEKAGLLKRAIEGVKEMAGAVSSGEALITQCVQVLTVLAPWLIA